MPEPTPVPPVAKTVPTTRSVHGDDVVDEYAWLRDKEDDEVIAHLEAENAYALAVMAPTKELQEAIFGEIKSRTLETDLSVPSRKGGWWYYTRTAEGSQYPVHCRARTQPVVEPYAITAPPSPADEVVLLDQNELAGDSPYFALGTFSTSPDQNLLAFSTDYDGSEKYTLRVKDLRTDEVLAGRGARHLLRHGLVAGRLDDLLHEGRRGDASVPGLAAPARHSRRSRTSSCTKRPMSGSTPVSG